MFQMSHASRRKKILMPPLSVLKTKNAPVKIWTPVYDVESSALTQLKNVGSLPWIFKHVAVMPDVHCGKGCTIGTIIASKDAVSPATVGVDIGCGMAAVKTSLTAKALPESLTKLRSAVEAAIPVGFHQHLKPIKGVDKLPLWKRFHALDKKVKKLQGKALAQCGTLGGGNHFIELCLDTENNVWLMLHSGSRNIGKTLAEIHIARAKKLAHNAALPDPDLAVFLANTREMNEYRHDLYWAQEYALENRGVMLTLYKNVIRQFFPNVKFEPAVMCHHNYVAEETHFGEDVFVTRKGAIRAGKGDLGIIPGSMGTKSYIVRGLGNADSFESASHGAGRRMSRNQAKKVFSKKDILAQTKGVECRKDKGILDEIPGAYKDIDTVMANQKDLVEIVAELKQVMCVKG